MTFTTVIISIDKLGIHKDTKCGTKHFMCDALEELPCLCVDQLSLLWMTGLRLGSEATIQLSTIEQTC